MWTAEKVSVDRCPTDKRLARVFIRYSDGVERETQAHDVRTEPQLDAEIAAQLAQYNATNDFIVAFAPGPWVPPLPPPPPEDPNAGLAPLSVEGLLGLLSEPSRARLDKHPSQEGIRRDVLNQDRDALRHRIALLVAREDPEDPTSVGTITQAEAATLLAALEQRA